MNVGLISRNLCTIKMRIIADDKDSGVNHVPPRLQRPIKQALFLAVLLTMIMVLHSGPAAQEARVSPALYSLSSMSRAQAARTTQA